MPSCCDGEGYDAVFTDRFARRVARRYRRHGLNATSSLMVDFLSRRGIEGASVLEIGGGVGEIQLELLRRGAARVTNLEISASYEEEARRLLEQSGMAGRVTRRFLDIAQTPDEVEPADVVVLHRVVCCYPDYERLLSAAGSSRRSAAGLQPPARERPLPGRHRCREPRPPPQAPVVPRLRASGGRDGVGPGRCRSHGALPTPGAGLVRRRARTWTRLNGQPGFLVASTEMLLTPYLALALRCIRRAGPGRVPEGTDRGPPHPVRSADCVISNGVINLCPDEAAVFAEAACILRPGGGLAISDLISEQALTARRGLRRGGRGAHVRDPSPTGHERHARRGCRQLNRTVGGRGRGYPPAA